MVSVQRIQENSAELSRRRAQFKEAAQLLCVSPGQELELRQLCAEHNQKYDELFFPGGSEMLLRLKVSDPVALEAAIQFLLADPYHFGSGYLKAYLWRRVQHFELSVSHKNRLEAAALKYLERLITREFWNMCKAMARLGRGEFWSQVAAKAQNINAPEGFRAFCLLTYGANIHAGAALRRAHINASVMRKYGGS